MKGTRHALYCSCLCCRMRVGHWWAEDGHSLRQHSESWSLPTDDHHAHACLQLLRFQRRLPTNERHELSPGCLPLAIVASLIKFRIGTPKSVGLCRLLFSLLLLENGRPRSDGLPTMPPMDRPICHRPKNSQKFSPESASRLQPLHARIR